MGLKNRSRSIRVILKVVRRWMDRAILIKEQIDQNEREPRHGAVEKVCIYLLKTRGYGATFRWVEDTYGEDFLPEDTKRQLERIIREEDLTVEIPPEYNHDSRD